MSVKSLVTSHLLAISLGLGCLLATHAGLAAGVDGLDELSQGAAVGARLIDGVQVSVTTGAGAMTVFTYGSASPVAFYGAASSANTPLTPGNLSGNRFMSTGLTTSMGEVGFVRFTFDRGVAEFGLTTLDLLEGAGTVTLTAFDGDGNVIDARSRTGKQGGTGLDLDWVVAMTAGGGPIAWAELTSDYAATPKKGYGIDDLRVTAAAAPALTAPLATPLPAAVWLLAPALGTLLVPRRRHAATPARYQGQRK